jgi:hypothetical protein
MADIRTVESTELVGPPVAVFVVKSVWLAVQLRRFPVHALGRIDTVADSIDFDEHYPPS